MGSLLSCALLISFTTVGSAAEFGPGVMSQAQVVVDQAQAKAYEREIANIDNANVDAGIVLKAVKGMTKCITESDGSKCYLPSWIGMRFTAENAAFTTAHLLVRIKDLSPELKEKLQRKYKSWMEASAKAVNALDEMVKNLDRFSVPDNLDSEKLNDAVAQGATSLSKYRESIREVMKPLQVVYGEQFVKPLKDVFDATDHYSGDEASKE